MPYIDKKSRRKTLFPTSPGELNYKITKLILDYLDDLVPLNYQDYNEVIGVLECCKLEFYARAVRKYEDRKIKENGDVYPEDSIPDRQLT